MSNEVFGGGSTNEYRPFVLSRPEPHSKTGQRVQVISGSANMSSRPTQFRFDSTSLAIRLFEHGMLPSWLTTDAPGNAIRLFASEQFGDNFNFKRAIQLGNRSLTAPQIQYEYASRAKALADEGFLNPYDTAFANRWIDMASDAVDGKIERWSRSIDWMAKLVLIERYRAKEPAITTAKMQGIDLSYHEIPVLHKTVREILRRGGVIDEYVSDEAVEAARLTTPEKTRAVIRGLAVTAAMKEKVDEDDGPFGWDKWPIKLTGDTDIDGRNIFQQITPYLLAE